MTFALAHNGGIGQVNLNYLGAGGDFPFINFVKSGGIAGLNDNSGYPDPDTLDSNGYPITIIGGGLVLAFFTPSKLARPGRKKIRWTGNGTVAIGMPGDYVAGSASSGVSVGGFGNSQYTSTTGSGEVLIANADEAWVLKIIETGSPRITNIEVFYEEEQNLLDAGEIFSPTFKALFAEGHIGQVRFLNWFDANLTTASTWASTRPETYIGYSGHEFRGSIYNPTGGTGTAYTMVAPSGWTGLADKAMVIPRFHTDATGPATLNVDGSGAKQILNWALTPLDHDTYMKASCLGMCFFDAKLDSWIKIGGGDIAHGQAGINNGVPPRLMMRLCAEVGAHPHFTIPHYALTPMTDLATVLATICRDEGPAWMNPVFEVSNELFNYFFGFNQSFYAAAIAFAYGWGTTNHESWCGKANSTLGQAVAAVYGVAKADVKTQTRYRVGGAVQTGGDLSTGGGQAQRFQSDLYFGQAEAAQDGYAKDRARDWLNCIICAHYYTPPIYNTPVEASMAAAYAGIRATVSISGDTLTIEPNFTSGLSIIGVMQAEIALRGVGAAGRLIIPGTKVVSGSGDTWTLNKTYPAPLTQIGVYGGLDMTIPDQYAENTSVSGSFGIPTLVAIYQAVKALALAYGIKKGIGYEGGYSPDLRGNVSEVINALRSASSYSDKVAKFNVLNCDAFYALTDADFTAEFVSNYLLTGGLVREFTTGVIRYGSVWAVLQDSYQDPRPPQWIAMVLYNKGNSSVLKVKN